MEENTKSNLDSTNSQQTSSVANDAQTPSAPPVSNADKPSGSLEQKAKAAQPKFSVGAIIGIIIFLLVSGGAAASFTVFKPQIMKLISKPTPTPTPTVQSPTPTPYTVPSSHETINWQTFTNSQLGFTFKYPQGWNITDHSYISGKEKYLGFAALGPARSDIEEAKGKIAHYIRVVKYDSISKSLVPNIAYGSSGEQFIFEHEKYDQAVKEVPVSDTFIKNSLEHQTAEKILSTFKFTENSVDNQPALERQDEDTRNTLVEFSNANIRYYTTHAGFPWSTTGPCQSSATATPNGTSLSQMVPCISLLIDEGELKGSFLSTNSQSISKIFVNSTESKLNICYKPQSIKEQQKPETIYDSFGKVDRSCVSTGNMCFWCSSI